MCVILAAATPAAAEGGPAAGRALTAPGAALRLQEEREVWIWADYWACRAVAGSVQSPPPGTEVIQVDGGELICTWMPNRWALVPSDDVCTLQPLAPDAPDLVTVCTPVPTRPNKRDSRP